MSEAVALGLRAHSGWTAAVAVAGSPIKPIILERRRIETADDRIAGSKQPYHTAKELSDETAETLIRHSGSVQRSWQPKRSIPWSHKSGKTALHPSALPFFLHQGAHYPH